VTQPVLDILGITTGQAEQLVTGVVTVVVASAYYTLARLVEQALLQGREGVDSVLARFPWIVLVGWPSTPSYGARSGAVRR
jgi:hypothetical protein